MFNVDLTSSKYPICVIIYFETVPESNYGLYDGTTTTQGYSGEWIQINMGDSTTKVNSLLLNHKTTPLPL